jgi:hypothetical protein
MRNLANQHDSQEEADNYGEEDDNSKRVSHENYSQDPSDGPLINQESQNHHQADSDSKVKIMEDEYE